MPPVADLRARWRRLLEDPAEAARRYPSLAAGLANPTERRTLLKMMAASMAMGGLTGCGDPAEPDGHWVPAVIHPPGIAPGLPNYYSTALTTGGTAIGLVVEHRMGRPTKIEGNRNHPSSLGSTDAFAQALLLDFYDPDRAMGLQHDGRPTDAPGFEGALITERERLDATHGAGLRILTAAVGSPTLGAAIAAALKRWPEARWVQWEPASRADAEAGIRLAYGRDTAIVPHADRADVVLALDSDLIGGAPGHVRHARDLMSRRNPTRATMNRIYAVEPTPTLIGGIADHRLPASPSELHAGIAALAAAVLHGQAADAPAWVAPVLADLKAASAKALIHAGPAFAPETHALVHAMNEALGARGTTFDLVSSPLYRPADQAADVAGLLADMGAGRVETLLVIGTNPAFTLPGFTEARKRVRTLLHASPAPDETSQLATWHMPETHLFETWGDARAHDGTASITQPQALPLYDGRSPLTLLQMLLGTPSVAPIDAVKQTWRDHLADEEAWYSALADGVIPGTASPVLDTKLLDAAATATPPAPPAAGLTVLFRPDPHLGDGRWANNPWLQELPRPLTKLTWDNPVLLAPATAKSLGVTDGDMCRVTVDGRTVAAPAWILPGQAPGVLTAQFGNGRRGGGDVAFVAGTDLYPLRGAMAVHHAAAQLERTGETKRLACTDHHAYLAAPPDDIARHGPLDAFQRDAAFLKGDAPDNSLYRERWNGPAAWGMSIDLNACIGCNACVVACNAENNVPTVGRDNVLKQREMHWLRIDRYWEGPEDDPDVSFQPMLCMHCEEAPCETVCPVGASMHDEEGLNVQVYNRCVGTRFCSNNCPYKVRRFNFGPYAAEEPRPEISRNPDVTVRARGVMEKCTFCIQRIAQTRVAHDRDGTPEQTTTACQTACPTQAFSFGNLRDPDAEVSRRKQSPLDYVLLPEQQTHPRVTYEARITNGNPALARNTGKT